jgi:hypothetical protein
VEDFKFEDEVKSYQIWGGSTLPAPFLNFKETFLFDVIDSFRLCASVKACFPLHLIPDIGKSMDVSGFACKASKKSSYEPNVTAFIHSFISGSTALLLGPGLFFSFVILFTQTVGLFWTGDQPVARSLHTHRTTQTK